LFLFLILPLVKDLFDVGLTLPSHDHLLKTNVDREICDRCAVALHLEVLY